MSIQRFGLYGVVQYVEGGIIKAKNINPALSDSEIEARLRDKGNADSAESETTGKAQDPRGRPQRLKTCLSMNSRPLQRNSKSRATDCSAAKSSSPKSAKGKVPGNDDPSRRR